VDRKGDVSAVNTSAVMRRIWLDGSTTRAELARTMNLHPATISRIVYRLEDTGLLAFGGPEDASDRGGRRPTRVMINPEFGFVVGLEIQTDMYHAVGIDIRGHTLFRTTGNLPERAGVMGSFQTALDELQPYLQSVDAPLVGLSVGLSGIIDPYSGVIHRSNPLSVDAPVDFRGEAAARLDVPILVENDANCGCWGELAAWGPDRPEDMLYVLGEFREPRAARREGHTLAIGIGFVLDGQVRQGPHFSTGEFQSILWKEENSSQFSLSDSEILRAAGDPHIRKQALTELAEHVGFVVNLLDLSHVVVGGDIVDDYGFLEPTFRAEIQRTWSYRTTKDCTVSFSRMGEYAVAYGAASMFVEHLFAIPEEGKRHPQKHVGIHLLEHIAQHVGTKTAASSR